MSENISLTSYIGIPDDSGLSFGGSQMWFPADGSRRDRLLRKGGCGLIAAADLLLYVSSREGLSLKPLTGKAGSLIPSSRVAYLELVRAFRRRYPVFPKIGSFNAEIPLFLNSALKKLGSHTRLRWCPLPTGRRLFRTVRASLAAGLPCILLIPPKMLPFTKMKGVPFYTFRDGRAIPCGPPVRAHFVTVTGIRCPASAGEPLFYEISSWGRKYYLNSGELAEYMSRAVIPLAGSLFYLK